MNSTTNLGDTEMGAEGPPGSVSRSGRVRKKNSLLAVYDSSDVVDKRKRRTGKVVKSNKMGNNIGIGGRPHAMGNNHTGHYQDYGEEEVIDHLSDGDGETNNKFYTNNSRLKSQAESTYMMEKTYVKLKKTPGPKKKATRKDKGSPRVTAYGLWAKEQRTNFTQKYPHMDFSSLSKKLSDLWATVPQNQKRMWKTKAAKIMKKNANGAEQRNIKNSTGPTLVLARKNLSMLQQRKVMMKNTTPEVPIPKKIGRPPKLPVAGIVVQKKISPPTNPNISQIVNHKPKKSKARRFTKTKRKKNFVPRNNALANHKLPQPPIPTPSSSHTAVVQSFSPASYQFNVNCGTDTLDVAAHLSLLGESMKNLGTSIQQGQHDTSEDSLSSLLDSLLCGIGPLLCLTRQVPELDCIPEDQLKRILGNSDYIMPGLQ